MESEEILALIDSMELTENFINDLLRKIMARTTYTKTHLENAIRFLKYKLAVNNKESLNCNNEQEYEFIGRLIRDASEESIDLLCEITNIVLQLDPKTIVGKAEHLLQQILSNITMPSLQLESMDNDDDTPIELLSLRLSSSILEAVISQKKKVSLLLFKVPLENMVFSTNYNILSFFYTSTIPNFYSGVTGYSILDRLWFCLKNTKEVKPITLKALSSLADYYLPLVEGAQQPRIAYTIAGDAEFWETVLFGLQSLNNEDRKRAIYLIKRALESLTGSQKDININTEEITMVWDKKNERILKSMWHKFFILIDSLQETQSNIVLPALTLFESVKHLGHCWLSCAYNIGLRHDNALVRLNCIKYRLEIKVESKVEALAFLNALNDINLFESPLDSNELLTNISRALEEKQSFINILEAFPSVKWSPVPFYYLSKTLGDVVDPTLLLCVNHKKVCSIINDILRIPCNSPIIKKAIYSHIGNLIINSCRGFTWEDYVSIYPNLHAETPITSSIMTDLYTYMKKNLYLSDKDKNGLVEAMTSSCENIKIALIYVSAHEKDGIPFFLSIIDEKVEKIINICKRSYANNAECFADVNLLINIYSNTVRRSEPYMVFVNDAVMKHNKVILHYFLCLLTETNLRLEVETISSLYDTLKKMPIKDTSAEDNLLQLYKITVHLLLGKDISLHKKTCAISIMNYVLRNCVMNENRRNEMLISLGEVLTIAMNIGNYTNVQDSGKLKNIFFERTCDIVLTYLKEEPNNKDVIDLFAFINDVLDRGGYACLKFILRIINNTLPKLIDNEFVPFDLSLLLSKIWVQICELKAKREYVACVDDYVKLITQDHLLKHPRHNTVIVKQYTDIIDMAVAKRMPLYFLVKHLSSRNILDYDNMVPILCNILLYAIVPKKEQSINDNIALELFPKMEEIIITDMHGSSHHIQLLSIAMLSKVTDVGKLNEISDAIMAKIDQILKLKPRYHSYSTTHRKLFQALQHLLFIFLKTRQVDVKKTATWCMKLLTIPHDVSVKTAIYWYIALYIYSKDINIDSRVISDLSQNGVPTVCQLTIVYLVMRHKICARVNFESETEFVLDFLLSHSMGPVFSYRLYAQYYAIALFEAGTTRRKVNMQKYGTLISIVEKTLADLSASEDKSYMNLYKDYFVHTFDIVADLSLDFIYNKLQRCCLQTQNIDVDFAKKMFDEIHGRLAGEDYDAFYMEWKGCYKRHSFVHYQGLLSTSQMDDKEEEDKAIQKKFIPSKNTTDPYIEKFRRNTKTGNKLLVVASLVNLTPNLGGIARTCEVFGVKSYVINNLRLVEDKQFQSLSVSADRWLKMEQVRAGSELKEYLQRKRKEGYCLVAAEQTSNSRCLNDFKFPKKSLVLLGNEKEGVPPNLLPLMNYCVEIPQQGIIRSLNVHVAASIFIWEYVKQNVGERRPPI